MEWAVVVQAFLGAVNRENGTLVHLPYAGGVLEQPYKTMQVFSLLQSIFIEEIEKANKKGRQRHGSQRRV